MSDETHPDSRPPQWWPTHLLHFGCRVSTGLILLGTLDYKTNVHHVRQRQSLSGMGILYRGIGRQLTKHWITFSWIEMTDRRTNDGWSNIHPILPALEWLRWLLLSLKSYSFETNRKSSRSTVLFAAVCTNRDLVMPWCQCCISATYWNGGF